jgi:OHCU decarboxylase
MNAVLAEWNTANDEVGMEAMLACCGARRWASAMVVQRPIADIVELSEAADRAWEAMSEADWMEAFACHPRIGERRAAPGSEKSEAWSAQEQASAEAAKASTMRELADGNAHYEKQFGFTYIVCATGKSAGEMLASLKRRLVNDRATELKEAAEQQRQIMQIRLGKWLLS